MYIKYVTFWALLLLIGTASANSIDYVSGPKIIYLGDDLNITVRTTSNDTVNYTLYNTTGNAVGTGSQNINNATGIINFSSSTLDETGNWSAIVTDGNITFTFNYTIVEAVYYNINLLESNAQNASRIVKVAAAGTYAAGTAFQVSDQNITKSGTLYNGTIGEAQFNCDLDGDNALTTTLYFWLSDIITSGVYDRAYIDDDAVLNETTETGKIPKTFLRQGDPTVKCVYVNSTSNWTQNATTIAPYHVKHIYPGGVYLELPPGPGDRPYQPGNNVDFMVMAYNRSRHPVTAAMSTFTIRYKNKTTDTWVETGMNPVLSAMGTTQLNLTLGSDGLTNTVTVNTTKLFENLSDSGPGEYAIIVNSLETETVKILPSWTVTILVGDPAAGSEKYDYKTGDPLAVGIKTTASNVSITVKVYDSSNDLRKSWYKNSTGSDGIFYDNTTAQYIAGMTTSYSPLLTVDLTGEWRVEVNVRSGTQERRFDRIINVKAFDLSLFAFQPATTQGEKPIFGQFSPGGAGFVGVFTMDFGKQGDIEDNLDEDDMIAIDANVSDSNNTCNSSIISFEIRDSDGNTVADHPDNWSVITAIDNLQNIMTTYGSSAPSEMAGQCAVYIANVSLATGEYTLTATVSASGSNTTATAMFEVQDMRTWAEPWDLTSNHYKRFFNPGDNVTLKVNTESMYTRAAVDPNDVVSVELVEVFNPDFGGIITDLTVSSGWGTATVSGENLTVLWIKFGNQTSGYHNINYRIKAQLNVSGTLRNATASGSGGVETKLYDIRGHPDFTRSTEYFRPDEDIALQVEVWGPQGPASNVDVYVESISLISDPDYEVNYSAARASSGADGRANVTIRPTSGNWEVGDYDVRLRVKDSQGSIDFGSGWFDVKSFQVVLIPVEVTVDGNTTECEEMTDFRDRGDKEDEMEKGGSLRISGDQAFAIFGYNENGTFQITPLFNRSKLFQLTNLNGEPVFDDVSPNVSAVANCTLTGIGRVKYFTLYTETLGGEYESHIMAQDASGNLGVGYGEFYISPFYLDVFMKIRGEPVFSPGDTMTFEAETEQSYNITGLSILRLIGVSGREDIVPGAAANISATVSWLAAVNWSRQFTLTLPPAGYPGLSKGEYVMQMQFTVTGAGGVNQTLVYNQWFIIKPFTYSIAVIAESWADSFNTSRAYSINYGCSSTDDWCLNDSRARGQYSVRYDQCPFPVINSSQQCALINMSDVRTNMLDLWYECSDCNRSYYGFLDYYNSSGSMNAFRGFYMIVGPISFESVSGAKVYVVSDPARLYWDNLTGLSAQDTITDGSGAVFRISQIRSGDVRLKPVKYATVWNIKSLYFNHTSRSQSGVIKIGAIREDYLRLDFNGDGNFSREGNFGMPFVLYDAVTSGVYDAARVDTDMDLDLDEEAELTIGGAGTTVNVSGRVLKLYLIKSDSFQTLFAFNDSGRDDWLGTHRKNTNITIPVYSKAGALNLSIAAIYDARRRTQITNYTVYNATVGADGVGRLVVSIPSPGHYVVQYRVASGSTTDLPEPWESPFIEVRAFDSQRDIVQEVITVPGFRSLNGTAARLSWWESRGYSQEWINNNGTVLQTMLSSLPSGFQGFALAESRCVEVSRDCSANTSIYLLYNRNSNQVYVRNSTTANFSGVTGASEGNVAYARTMSWPSSSGSTRNVTVTLAGRRCWFDSCNLILQESQHVPTLDYSQTPNGFPCHTTSAGELCAVWNRAPHSNYYVWVNVSAAASGTNATQIIVFTNVTNFESDDAPNLSRSHQIIAINASGQPNTSVSFTVSGDVNEEDWCVSQPGGCIGGEYIAHVSIINVTYSTANPAVDRYIVYYNVDELYNNSDFWADMEVNSSLSLIGPSSSYYVRYIGWKGVWMATDISNASDPQLYVSTTGNFTGLTGARVGDTISIYDRWLTYSTPFNLKALNPKSYGSSLMHLNVNLTVGQYIVWIDSINTFVNQTRFWVVDTSCQGCGAGSTTVDGIGNTEEMNSVRVTLDAIHNATSVTATLATTSTQVQWGYNTDSLNSSLNSSFYNESYQKQVGNLTLNGVNYIIVALDSNSSSSDADFNQVFVSNDTTLTSNELIPYGNASISIPGTGYYISNLDNDKIVLLQNVVSLIGVPYSDDGIGYYYSILQPVNLTGDLKNSTANITLVMYAEERWDEPTSLGRLWADDDVNALQFDDDCYDMGEFQNCTDRDALTQAVTAEAGRIAEGDGNIGEWNNLNLKVKNASSGLFYQRWYNSWDRNTSDPIRFHRWFDGWWGEYLTNQSNITLALKVTEFNGSAVQGNATLIDIYMMGELYGEWVEQPLSAFNNINYSVYYDGVSSNSTVLDSDGIMYMTITLADSTSWWNGFGYEIRVHINSTAGDGEETSMWFDLGRRYREDDGGSDACDSIVDQSVCGNYSSVCEWNSGAGACVSITESIVCQDFMSDGECIDPCVWVAQQGNCVSCSDVTEQSNCDTLNALGYSCDWDSGENECYRFE